MSSSRARSRQRQFRSFQQKLIEVDTALSNALADEAILNRLASYGCDAEHLRQGQALYEDALHAHQGVPNTLGLRREAIATFRRYGANAKQIYARHLEGARDVFKDDTRAISTLLLAGQRGRRYTDWRNQANQFYGELLADAHYIAQMNQAGISTAQLEQGKQWVGAVRNARLGYERTAGRVQTARRTRDQACDAMTAWFRTFRKIAKGALGDRADLLRKLVLTQLTTNPEMPPEAPPTEGVVLPEPPVLKA